MSGQSQAAKQVVFGRPTQKGKGRQHQTHIISPTHKRPGHEARPTPTPPREEMPNPPASISRPSFPLSPPPRTYRPNGNGNRRVATPPSTAASSRSSRSARLPRCARHWVRQGRTGASHATV